MHQIPDTAKVILAYVGSNAVSVTVNEMTALEMAEMAKTLFETGAFAATFIYTIHKLFQSRKRAKQQNPVK